jgi:hypothetical protein
MTKRELTPEQAKAKRADEIACRVSLSLFVIFMLIQVFTR